MEDKINCPLCELALDGSLSATCSTCGLWWISKPSEVFHPSGRSGEPPVGLRLKLRRIPTVVSDLVFLTTACLGLGTALAVVWTVTLNPSDRSEWVRLAIGLPLGAWVGMSCLAIVTANLAHAVLPSRLEGDPSRLRVRLWNTWEGVWRGFRRIERIVPRDQIEGIAFSIAQGGDTHLFILHSSGLSFGTGWRGSRDRATRHKEALLAWMA